MKLGRASIGLVIWLLLALSAGWIGSMFMPGQWYDSLVKPSWNPPASVFAPVWTVLYVLMGTAAWLIWKKTGFAKAKASLTLFLVQLLLNSLWSYLFFGTHQPMYAFFEILILWSAILLTMLGFWRISPPAGMLLIPYLLWVSFASALNFQLWQLNLTMQ